MKLTFAIAVALSPLAFAWQKPVVDDLEPIAAELQVEAYGGNLSDGLAEVAALTLADKYDESLVLSESLLAPSSFLAWRHQQKAGDTLLDPVLTFVEPGLDWLGLMGPPAAHRAEVHYARGVLLMRRGKVDADGALRDASASEYESARRLAGPGELRNASIYNLGVGWLEEAERVRLEIPEVRQKLGLPELPPTAPTTPAGPPADDAEEAPDPIEVARGFYLQGREHFTERLRIDWRDQDTRANVELIQRRLRELDEIEQQREEQEQEQQDSEDEQDDSEESEDGEESEEESEEEKEGDPSEEEQPQDEPGEEEQPEEPEEPEPGEGEEPEEAPATPPPGEPEERTLTREEVMRLLEQLKKIEAEGEKVQEQLRDRRRVPVKRDW